MQGMLFIAGIIKSHIHIGDLICHASNYWTYNTADKVYPKMTIPANFTVEGYEVFQVIKK